MSNQAEITTYPKQIPGELNADYNKLVSELPKIGVSGNKLILKDLTEEPEVLLDIFKKVTGLSDIYIDENRGSGYVWTSHDRFNDYQFVGLFDYHTNTINVNGIEFVSEEDMTNEMKAFAIISLNLFNIYHACQWVG